jgi:hypothetical protein
VPAFAKKLARLNGAGVSQAPIVPAAAALTPEDPSGGRPSLDELRDRIARLVGGSRSPMAAPVRHEDDEAWDLCMSRFAVEQTPIGGVNTARVATMPGERVGVAPVHAARAADPSVLALLALDPTLAGCDPTRALYVDTETTGLAGGAGTLAFLVGLAWFDAELGRFVVEQLLLTDLGAEAPLMHRVKERLEAASMIVTFNGKAFDLPLLRTRAIMTRVGALPERPHLDLLHVVRRLHKHRLGGCSLGRVEDIVLGRERVGDVSGADIVLVYAHYLRTRDLSVLGPVVEHNRLDVVSMISLVGMYGEPLEAWAGAGSPIGAHAGDLAAAATVARRAGDLDSALVLADLGVSRGGGARALSVRGDVLRARGDKARALSDYEAALESSVFGDEDATASLRLTLAKLYEHHARAYEKALRVIASGTREEAPQHDKRRSRLVKKLARTPRAS